MKKILTPVLVALLVVAALASSAVAAAYKWVDEEGTVNITNDYLSIPPQHRSKAKQLIMTDAPPSSPIKSGYDLMDRIIPFVRASSGILLVDVLINESVGAKMVFDTGATTIVLSRELAEKIARGSSPDERTVRMRTAGGEVEGRYITLSRLDAGQASRENIRAIINPQAGVFKGFDGLLGMSFFEGFEVTIDHQGSRIILKRR